MRSTTANVRCVVVALVFLLSAACSANGGFGGFGAPPPAPQYPQGQVTPIPSPSGGGPPFGIQQKFSPAPTSSPLPGPSGSGSASAAAASSAKPELAVQNATARLAYDGSAIDPIKAGKILELTFTVKNTTAAAATFSGLSIKDGDRDAGTRQVALSAAAGGSTDALTVALKPTVDLSAVKQVTLVLSDDKSNTSVSATIDGAPADASTTPLDEKHPSGGVTLDGIDVLRVDAQGARFHYAVTFALTNASSAKLDITGFLIAPPKGAPARVALPITLLPRATTGFVSIIVPYGGKLLPVGSYTITALSGAVATAKGSGALL